MYNAVDDVLPNLFINIIDHNIYRGNKKKCHKFNIVERSSTANRACRLSGSLALSPSLVYTAAAAAVFSNNKIPQIPQANIVQCLYEYTKQIRFNIWLFEA